MTDANDTYEEFPWQFRILVSKGQLDHAFKLLSKPNCGNQGLLKPPVVKDLPVKVCKRQAEAEDVAECLIHGEEYVELVVSSMSEPMRVVDKRKTVEGW